MDSDKKEKKKLKQQECKKRNKVKDDYLPEANEAKRCEIPTKKIKVTEEKQAGRAKESVKKEEEKEKSIEKKRTKPSIVILDLDTTGLIKGNTIPDITQIAASKIGSRKTFYRYVSPEQIISDDAKTVSGIDWSNGILTYQGNPVDFVGIKTALNDFLDWLKKFDDVIIVAQYGLDFDFKVLDWALCSCDMKDRFNSIGAALCDSINIIKEKHPGLESYAQKSLAWHFCGETYDTHNATDDVAMLKKILENAGISTSDFRRHAGV